MRRIVGLRTSWGWSPCAAKPAAAVPPYHRLSGTRGPHFLCVTHTMPSVKMDTQASRRTSLRAIRRLSPRVTVSMRSLRSEVGNGALLSFGSAIARMNLRRLGDFKSCAGRIAGSCLPGARSRYREPRIALPV